MDVIFEGILLKVLAGVAVALLFGLAVFVHELGHYLMARRLGLVIDTFSIGFGPALWKRRIGGVEYRISWIPLGGYVALPQLDPAGMEAIQGEHAPDAPKDGDMPPPRMLPDIAPWRRIAVSIAGPAGNIVLAVLLAWIIYFAPNLRVGGAGTTVGLVATNSLAYASGLRPGDRVLAVNNVRVGTWDEFRIECHLAGDISNGLSVAVQRGESEQTLRIPVTRDATTGIVTVEDIAPQTLCLVAMVVSNSPAAHAGIQPGDIVDTVEGAHVLSMQDVTQRISAHGTRPIQVGLKRAGTPVSLTMIPAFSAELQRPVIGVVFDDGIESVPPWMQYRRPMRQLTHDAKGVVRILRALVAPRTRGEAKRAASGLSGPLVIMVTLWYQVRTGLLAGLAFLRFLCVNLALLNLLPLPVLDGGHVMFALWEMMTGRKPHARVVNILANVFAALLIGLMVLLTFRDAIGLHRIFGRARREAAEARQAATNDVTRATNEFIRARP